jgi:hypothetical protein
MHERHPCHACGPPIWYGGPPLTARLTAGDPLSSVLCLFLIGQTQDLIFYLEFLSLYVRKFLVAHGWMGQGFLEPLLEDAVLLGKLVQMT